jgi:hypothetical protein
MVVARNEIFSPAYCCLENGHPDVDQILTYFSYRINSLLDQIEILHEQEINTAFVPLLLEVAELHERIDRLIEGAEMLKKKEKIKERRILIERIGAARTFYYHPKRTVLNLIFQMLLNSCSSGFYVSFLDCIEAAQAMSSSSKKRVKKPRGSSTKSFRIILNKEKENLKKHFGLLVLFCEEGFKIAINPNFNPTYPPPSPSSPAQDSAIRPHPLGERILGDLGAEKESSNPYSLLEINTEDQIVYENALPSSTSHGSNSKSSSNGLTVFPEDTNLYPLIVPDFSNRVAYKQYLLLLKTLKPEKGEIIVVKAGEEPRVFYKVLKSDVYFFDRDCVGDDVDIFYPIKD